MSKPTDIISQKLEEILVKLETLEKNQKSLFSQLANIQNSLLSDASKKDKKTSSEDNLSDLVEQLKALKLGSSSKAIPAKKGNIFVFKNPYTLLKEEQEKAKQK